MPQTLIIAACLINFEDDRGGLHHAEGEIADVPKETARKLAEAGRLLYVSKADDHTKAGLFTADPALVKAAEAAAKAAAKSAAA